MIRRLLTALVFLSLAAPSFALSEDKVAAADFTLVDLANFVANAGIKKHPLASSGFASVNMRDDTKVADFFNRIVGHDP